MNGSFAYREPEQITTGSIVSWVARWVHPCRVLCCTAPTHVSQHASRVFVFRIYKGGGDENKSIVYHCRTTRSLAFAMNITATTPCEYSDTSSGGGIDHGYENTLPHRAPNRPTPTGGKICT